MSNRVDLTRPILPPDQTGSSKQPSRTRPSQSFVEVMRQQEVEVPRLKFSQHAQQRIDARNISLGPKEMERLNQAVEKAAQKGARESLVLMDQMAFVVSVPNKTVITAVDGPSIKDNVFTNIDSAVIV
ncbi:MAG: TIGR02530 family flagellar biosynthesis protein [Bacillota bacterium]